VKARFNGSSFSHLKAHTNTRLNTKISFSEDTAIIINLKLNNSETQKIGLTWYRIICYIDILTIKNKTKTLYIDLSDQFLNFMIKEPYTENEQTQNLKHFIDLNYINELNFKAEEYEKNNKDEIIGKCLMMNPRLMVTEND